MMFHFSDVFQLKRISIELRGEPANTLKNRPIVIYLEFAAYFSVPQRERKDKW